MADQQVQTTQGTSGPPNYPSLNIISELTKERVDAQLEQVNALDTKANFILGSATALISAALILQAALLPGLLPTASNNHNTNTQAINIAFSSNWPYFLPLIFLLIIYLIVMISAFLAYRIRTFKQVPNPETLYKAYLTENEETTKAAVFRAMLEAYKLNTQALNYKVRWINIAFLCLGLEVLALASVLLFQTVL